MLAALQAQSSADAWELALRAARHVRVADAQPLPQAPGVDHGADGGCVVHVRLVAQPDEGCAAELARWALVPPDALAAAAAAGPQQPPTWGVELWLRWRPPPRHPGRGGGEGGSGGGGDDEEGPCELLDCRSDLNPDGFVAAWPCFSLCPLCLAAGMLVAAAPGARAAVAAAAVEPGAQAAAACDEAAEADKPPPREGPGTLPAPWLPSADAERLAALLQLMPAEREGCAQRGGCLPSELPRDASAARGRGGGDRGGGSEDGSEDTASGSSDESGDDESSSTGDDDTSSSDEDSSGSGDDSGSDRGGRIGWGAPRLAGYGLSSDDIDDDIDVSGSSSDSGRADRGRHRRPLMHGAGLGGHGVGHGGGGGGGDGDDNDDDGGGSGGGGGGGDGDGDDDGDALSNGSGSGGESSDSYSSQDPSEYEFDGQLPGAGAAEVSGAGGADGGGGGPGGGPPAGRLPRPRAERRPRDWGACEPGAREALYRLEARWALHEAAREAQRAEADARMGRPRWRFLRRDEWAEAPGGTKVVRRAEAAARLQAMRQLLGGPGANPAPAGGAAAVLWSQLAETGSARRAQSLAGLSLAAAELEAGRPLAATARLLQRIGAVRASSPRGAGGRETYDLARGLWALLLAARLPAHARRGVARAAAALIRTRLAGTGAAGEDVVEAELWRVRLAAVHGWDAPRLAAALCSPGPADTTARATAAGGGWAGCEGVRMIDLRLSALLHALSLAQEPEAEGSARGGGGAPGEDGAGGPGARRRAALRAAMAALGRAANGISWAAAYLLRDGGPAAARAAAELLPELAAPSCRECEGAGGRAGVLTYLAHALRDPAVPSARGLQLALSVCPSVLAVGRTDAQRWDGAPLPKLARPRLPKDTPDCWGALHAAYEAVHAVLDAAERAARGDAPPAPPRAARDVGRGAPAGGGAGGRAAFLGPPPLAALAVDGAFAPAFAALRGDAAARAGACAAWARPRVVLGKRGVRIGNSLDWTDDGLPQVSRAAAEAARAATALEGLPLPAAALGRAAAAAAAAAAGAVHVAACDAWGDPRGVTRDGATLAHAALERLAAAGHTHTAAGLARALLQVPTRDTLCGDAPRSSARPGGPRTHGRRQGPWWRFSAAWCGAEWLLQLRAPGAAGAAGALAVARSLAASLQEGARGAPHAGGKAPPAARGARAGEPAPRPTPPPAVAVALAAAGAGAERDGGAPEQGRRAVAGGPDARGGGGLGSFMADLVDWKGEEGGALHGMRWPGGLGAAYADLARCLLWPRTAFGLRARAAGGGTDGASWEAAATLAALAWAAAEGERAAWRVALRGGGGVAGYKPGCYGGPRGCDEAWIACLCDDYAARFDGATEPEQLSEEEPFDPFAPQRFEAPSPSSSASRAPAAPLPALVLRGVSTADGDDERLAARAAGAVGAALPGLRVEAWRLVADADGDAAAETVWDVNPRRDRHALHVALAPACPDAGGGGGPAAAAALEVACGARHMSWLRVWDDDDVDEQFEDEEGVMLDVDPGLWWPHHAQPLRRPELLLRLLLRILSAAPSAAARCPLLAAAAAAATRAAPCIGLLPLAAACAREGMAPESRAVARRALLPLSCHAANLPCAHAYYSRVFGAAWLGSLQALLAFLSGPQPQPQPQPQPAMQQPLLPPAAPWDAADPEGDLLADCVATALLLDGRMPAGPEVILQRALESVDAALAPIPAPSARRRPLPPAALARPAVLAHALRVLQARAVCWRMEITGGARGLPAIGGVAPSDAAWWLLEHAARCGPRPPGAASLGVLRGSGWGRPGAGGRLEFGAWLHDTLAGCVLLPLARHLNAAAPPAAGAPPPRPRRPWNVPRGEGEARLAGDEGGGGDGDGGGGGGDALLQAAFRQLPTHAKADWAWQLYTVISAFQAGLLTWQGLAALLEPPLAAAAAAGDLAWPREAVDWAAAALRAAAHAAGLPAAAEAEAAAAAEAEAALSPGVERLADAYRALLPRRAGASLSGEDGGGDGAGGGEGGEDADAEAAEVRRGLDAWHLAARRRHAGGDEQEGEEEEEAEEEGDEPIRGANARRRQGPGRHNRAGGAGGPAPQRQAAARGGGARGGRRAQPAPAAASSSDAGTGDDDSSSDDSSSCGGGGGGMVDAEAESASDAEEGEEEEAVSSGHESLGHGGSIDLGSGDSDGGPGSGSDEEDESSSGGSDGGKGEGGQRPGKGPGAPGGGAVWPCVPPLPDAAALSALLQLTAQLAAACSLEDAARAAAQRAAQDVRPRRAMARQARGRDALPPAEQLVGSFQRLDAALAACGARVPPLFEPPEVASPARRGRPARGGAARAGSAGGARGSKKSPAKGRQQPAPKRKRLRRVADLALGRLAGRRRKREESEEEQDGDE